jgi:predicted CXXCH cytochrome family protein
VSASFLLAALLAAPARGQETCGVCHGDVARLEASGVHGSAGIDCVACHGGTPGALDAALAHAGRVPLPGGPRAGVLLCGGCHADAERMRGFGSRTDQLLLYGTSAHGKRLAMEDDPDVATCASCHGAHGVLSAADLRSSVHPLRQAETCGRCHADEILMARHGVSTAPSREFPASVHGRALLEQGWLSSPSCAGCHGAHGAAPPRVVEVGRVCGGCHAAVERAFEASPHRAASEVGALEECISCHGSHAASEPSPDMLVGDAERHCGACHAPDTPAARAGAALHSLLADFDARFAGAEAALDAAERRGSFLSRERDWLAEARSVRRRAGPDVHGLDPRALDEVLDLGRGMIAETLEGLREEERALFDRRILVGVFVAIVLLLAAVLWIHAREVAGRAEGEPGLFVRRRRAGARDGAERG